MADFDWSRLAAQYGQAFADESRAHYEADRVVKTFSEAHPLHIPNPDPSAGPNSFVRSPEPHTLYREGDFLGCRECATEVYAPSPPARPLTPMEASLSPFD